MWCELIETVSSDCRFKAPANPSAISRAEAELSVAFPEQLKDLLLETDGIEEKYGFSLVLPVGDIVQTNLDFRSNSDFAELYMPFDPLLLFGAAANSDYFALRILKTGIEYDAVYRWDHETDSRIWVAPSLERYLEWRLTRCESD